VQVFGWKSRCGQAIDAGRRTTVSPHLAAIQRKDWRPVTSAGAPEDEISNGETLMPYRMIDFINHARPVLTAAAFFMGASVTAMAQDAPAATGGDISHWLKVCDPKNPAVCAVTKDYIVESGPNALATFTVQTTADPKTFGVGVTVPPGFIFPPGIPISVDSTKISTAQYVLCWPDGPKSTRVMCIAQAQVKDDFVAALKKGGSLQLQLTTGEAKTVPINFSLSGFTAVFDGPDMGEGALVKQREEVAKLFQEKAQQRGQQLIEEQRKAKAGGG
jgi:invasion protein IalB